MQRTPILTSPPSHQPWLFVDACGVTPRLGIWQANTWLAYREKAADARDALVASAQAVLAEAGITWAQLQGYIYVEGPGAVLGLRMAAMALRAWQVDDGARSPTGHPRPLVGCGSLHLAAALALAGGAQVPFTVCTEARQGAWHVLALATAAEPALENLRGEIIAGETLAAWPGQLFYLPARKVGSKPPARAEPVPASLRDHPEVLASPGLCRSLPQAVPFTGPAADYQKWAGATAAD